MSLRGLSDENVLRLYESVREQVSADLRSGSPHRLLGKAAQERAEELEAELMRRGVQFLRIQWY